MSDWYKQHKDSWQMAVAFSIVMTAILIETIVQDSAGDSALVAVAFIAGLGKFLWQQNRRAPSSN